MMGKVCHEISLFRLRAPADAREHQQQPALQQTIPEVQNLHGRTVAGKVPQNARAQAQDLEGQAVALVVSTCEVLAG